MSNVIVSSHPVVQHKLSLIRQADTTTPVFRQLLRELSFNLGYEARGVSWILLDAVVCFVP